MPFTSFIVKRKKCLKPIFLPPFLNMFSNYTRYILPLGSLMHTLCWLKTKLPSKRLSSVINMVRPDLLISTNFDKGLNFSVTKKHGLLLNYTWKLLILVGQHEKLLSIGAYNINLLSCVIPNSLVNFFHYKMQSCRRPLNVIDPEQLLITPKDNNLINSSNLSFCVNHSRTSKDTAKRWLKLYKQCSNLGLLVHLSLLSL